MEFADWTRAYVMMGDSPVGLREVLLAADGSLYALLRGETALGVLQTVRLDDQGRMSAFVIDSVDAWGQMLSIGNAELAARLGSPVIYEQSGRVQFIETFGQGLALWEPVTDGLGAGIEVSPEYSMGDGYSAKLTGGRDGEWYARITHQRGGLPGGSVGLAFACASATDFANVMAHLVITDGASEFTVGLMLDGANDKLKVWLNAEAWQEVGSVNPSSNVDGLFYFAKITADLTTGYYKELRFNQVSYPVSTHLFLTDPKVAPAIVKMELEVTSVNGENNVVYFDNVILTAAES